MTSEQFHMDEWLQRSAALGDIPVHEPDWQQMKNLLKPRKKRRFFFWLWLALLLFVGAGGWLIVRNTTKTKQPVIISSQKQKNINSSLSASEIKPPADIDGKIIDKEDMASDHNKKTVPVKDAQTNRIVTIGDTAKTKSTPVNIIQYPVKEKATAFVSGSTNKKENRLDASDNEKSFKQTRNKKTVLDKKAKQSMELQAGDTGHLDSLNDSRLSITGTRDIASFLLTEKAAMTRPFPYPVDSTRKILIQLKEIASSINKKNKKSLATDKGYWFTEPGFAKGNMPLSGQSFGLNAGRSFSLGKHFSFNAGAGFSLFNGGEPQTHKQVTSITSIPGTTFYFVDTRETKYKTGNGKLFTTAAAFTYKNKSWEISSGAGFGTLLSAKNITSSFYDTATSYPSQPQGITVSGAYDPARFNGKQFIALNFELKYRVFKKYYTGIGAGKELWRQSFEGITDENKKRFSFRIFSGIRF